MKKIITCIAVLLAVFSLSSCLKDKGFDNQQYGLTTTGVNERAFVYLLEGGERQFTRSNLRFANNAAALDSVEFSVMYVGPAGSNGAPAPTDITVTLGIDNAARLAYNAVPANAKYDAFPDSTFIFTTFTTTIKAGTFKSPIIKIYFKPNKIDASKLYMLPISILTVSNGLFISSNQKTVFYHIIGNALAGKYTWRYRRWQSGDTTTAPLQDLLNQTNLLPVSASELMTREQYTETFVDPAGGIVLGFTETAGIPGNFNLSLLPSTVAGITAGGFSLLDGPKFATGGTPVVVGNAASNFIGTRLSTYIQYLNSSGGTRTLVNSFVKIP